MPRRMEDDLELLEPPSSVLLSRGKKRRVFADSDSDVDFNFHLGSPNVSKPWTTDIPTSQSKRKRMAYVLVPQRKRHGVPSIPSRQAASSTLPPAALPSDQENTLMQSCMVSAEELKNCEPPSHYYAQAEEAFKYTFGIDLSKVPGRTRKWSGKYGVYVRILFSSNTSTETKAILVRPNTS